MSNRARRLVGAASSVLFGLLLGFVVVEVLILRLLLGYHGICDPDVFQYDRELGWKLKPSIQRPHSTLDFSVTITTNELGMRVAEGEAPGEAPAEARAPGADKRRTILVLGDSFAFGWGVSAKEMFSTQLQDHDTRVLTAGVPGYSTDQQYLLWRRLSRKIGPQVVMLLMYENDIEGNALQTAAMVRTVYSKPYFDLVGGRLKLRGVPVPGKRVLPSATSARLEPIKAALRRFASYALLQQALHNVLARRNRAAIESATTLDPGQRRRALLITKTILSTMKRDVEGMGAKFMVVLVDTKNRWARREMAKACGDSAIPFLDLTPEMQSQTGIRFAHDLH